MQFSSEVSSLRAPGAALAATVLVALLAAACGDATPAARSAPLPAPVSVPAAPRPPNVLLIVVDTLRGDRCNFAGYDRATTPHLSEFAREAVVFRNAWSPTCWTPPAHATLFTGLRPEHHGVITGNRTHLPDSFQTVAEALREQGYATHAYINNPLLASAPSLLRGFQVVDYPFDIEGLDASRQRTAHLTVDAILDAVDLQRERGQPFFIFANLFEPHLPYTPPEAAAASFVRRDRPDVVAAARAVRFPDVARHSLGGERLSSDVVASMSDLYDAEIAGVDMDIGVLLDGLRERGVLDDTLVVITSDHGEGFDEHGRLDHLQHLHAELLHIPLLVRYPNSRDGGRVHDEIVRLEDVTATIYDVCGVPTLEAIDGVSLTADLSDRVARAALDENDVMTDIARRFAPGGLNPTFPAERSVRSGRYHLIVQRDGASRLFDFDADPLEQLDLAEQLPEIVETLMPLVVW